MGKGVVAAIAVMLIAGGSFGERFEADCASGTGWDVLDFVGDGTFRPVEGVNCPPGYGPKVLRMEGSELLVLPKGGAFLGGTVVVLYRENDPRDRDSDGVILFGAQVGEDLSVIHNTKEKCAHAWVEQDNDTGFQVRQFDAGGKESTLAEHAGLGLITDPWNATGWIWQKVHIGGSRVKAKFWPAQEPEPKDWIIETDTGLQPGRIGAIVHSGHIDIACFAFDADADIATTAPLAYLAFSQERATTGDDLLLWLFTNRDRAVEASCRIEVRLDGHAAGETTLSIPIPAGHAQTPLRLAVRSPSGGGLWLPLDKPLGAGSCTVSISGAIETVCRFPIAPVEVFAKTWADAARRAELFRRFMDGAAARDPRLEALCDAACAHTGAAEVHYRAGRLEKAGAALAYANEALAELRGYKGARLRAAGGDPDALVPPADAPLPERPEPKEVATIYSPDYSIRFGEANLEAQSMVMGRTYRVSIPWQVEGASPDRDYAFHVALTSPLGSRTVASAGTPPKIPSSAWKAGETYEQVVELRVSPENPDPSVHPEQPAVLDEYHYLVAGVTDPVHGGALLLDNAPGPQPDRIGAGYLLGQVYVSSAPVEIRGFDPRESPVLAPRTDSATFRNVGTAPVRATALFSVQADTKRVLHEAVADVDIPPGGECPVAFEWMPDTAGESVFRIQLVLDGNPLTEAQKTIVLIPPEGYAMRAEKENHVGEDLAARVTVHAGKGPVSASVFAKGRLAGSAKSDGPTVTIAARPWFGYYDIEADLGTFRYAKRIVATVVETRGTDLLVNGEPFLIKGTNVHGMDPSSPARTAAMFRIMRGLGFNTWRGDFPARWQLELAHELNTVYTALAPFSCIATRNIFARQDGPPMAVSRELTRVFIERYKDSAGLLLWNSCNEIEGDSIDFLVSQYPLYKRLDPYARPVHYANLYGQDYWQGQDVMGVNCYFSGAQTAESRHPILRRSLDIAHGAGLPLIFCEFNSFNGAVHSQGADAMRNLYAWGVEQGMAGGFQYMKENSTSHPGIIDPGFNTHALYDNAIVKAFADADVSLLAVSGDTAKARIHNRRRFTLREVVLNPVTSGQSLPPVPIPDLPPGANHDIELAMPRIHGGPARIIEGRLEFVTHFGFAASVPVRLIVR
ncbi:MAG TPA: hypothetical protein P5318_16820 [Candidatus Hydrogenedentes bacterium]|nr:hypothetical protein [Candidatus Hydrogenedentota bacterium]HPC18189.1 hypothetical protein [Candidatus Hydrogenedentota bacterium]HRT21780.1 hypothetical protein [Candidatus Hydrogenedentota bacterium]HRT66600.1 hypothetical protein [Candidatus Hydrogenedentota bacterium]